MDDGLVLDWMRREVEAVCVLILIVVDDGLVHVFIDSILAIPVVLILIVVEDGLSVSSLQC